MSDASVKVICRFRPVNEREKSEGEREDAPQLSFPDEQTVVVNIPNQKPQIFQFDRVFWDTRTKQIDIYELSAKETINDIFAGYNGTIFAYGQTGAGKSFTMFGPESSSLLNEQRDELKGIIPRACEHIFDKIMNDEAGTEFFLKCSFLEIYKENIRDLLEPSRVNLKVRETPSQGVWVQDLSEHFISCIEDIYALLQLGEKSRAVSSTNMNQVSSRSHSLFILTLTQKNSDGSTKEGKLNLADLAGSEKVGKTGASGETLEEAKKINQSLSALGNCINALTKSKKGHIPYRDSRLTHILRESLGGNSKTTLIIACSPHSFNIEETISTLKFGQRAKSIKNKVKVNQQRSVKELESIIENMTKELTNSKRYIDFLEEALTGFDQSFDFSVLKKRVGNEKRKEDNDSENGSAPSTPRKGMDDLFNPISAAEFNVKIEQLKEKHELEIQDLLEEIRNLKMNKSQIDEEMYESIQNELESYKEEVENLKSTLRSNDSIIKEKNTIIDELNEDKQTLIQKVELLKKENTDLLEDKNLNAQEKLTMQNQLSIYLEEIQKSEFTLKENQATIELLKAEKEAIEKRCNESEEKVIKIEEEANDLRKELSHLKSSFIDIEMQLQSKTNEVEKLSKQTEEIDMNNELKEELEEEKKKNIELLSNLKKKVNEYQDLEEELRKEKSKGDQILDKFQNLQSALEQNEIRFSEREKRWNDRVNELELILKNERVEKEQLRNEVASLVKKLTERDSVIKSTEEALALVKRENEIGMKKLINQFGDKIKSLTDQIESLISERDAAVDAYKHVQEKLIQVQLNENINQPIINIPKKTSEKTNRKIAVPIKGGVKNNNNNNINSSSPQNGSKKRIKYTKNDLPTYDQILNPIKTGFLWIQSSVLRKWDEIFCFLEGHRIYYFRSKESERADGLFDIEDCVSKAVTLNETFKDRYPFIIDYKDDDKPLLLFAETEEERKSWIEVINETSQKTIEMSNNI